MYRVLLLILVFMASVGLTAFGQSPTFSSGSTGADGALNLTTPGLVTFDPKNFNPQLHPNGDAIYNFTTITIANGVTVRLSANFLSGPVYWLASGAVQINGTIDLTGEKGPNGTDQITNRIPAAGGAGGYGGGLGGNATLTAFPGNGPGGGSAASPGVAAKPGTFTGNQYLVPLVGGSGGGGDLPGCSAIGPSGGAGGGALLIASSASINLDGANIDASGGATSGGCGTGSVGNGSGGAIRLVAPAINSTGRASFINVGGGNAGAGAQNYPGRIRLEAFAQNWNSTNLGLTGPYVLSVPFALALPATPPGSIKVTAIGGITVNANPFTFPDVPINTNAPVTINVQANYVPIGTVPKIIIFGESGPDQIISCSPLAGTLQQTTCSASVTFVTGGSRGFVKATW